MRYIKINLFITTEDCAKVRLSKSQLDFISSGISIPIKLHGNGRIHQTAKDRASCGFNRGTAHEAQESSLNITQALQTLSMLTLIIIKIIFITNKYINNK